MMRNIRSIGTICMIFALTMYLICDDPRWLAASGTYAIPVTIVCLIRWYRGVACIVDDDDPYEHPEDMYWSDAMNAATAAVDALDMQQMAARFCELDRNPLVRLSGTQARRRDRLRGMHPSHRHAWAGLVEELEGQPALTVPCTCGVMRGVMVPSRACPLHGTGAT